jgi:hypothetical protein
MARVGAYIDWLAQEGKRRAKAGTSGPLLET